MTRSGDTAIGPRQLSYSAQPQTPVVDDHGRLVSPVPGLTATIYSPHNGVPLMVVHFVSYVRVAGTTTAHFSRGDYIVQIEGVSHPIRCMDLGLAPHGHQPCGLYGDESRYFMIEGGVRTRKLSLDELRQSCQCGGCSPVRAAS